MTVYFQKCKLSDCKKLAELSRVTFIDAFEKQNNPEDFKDYIDSAFSENAIIQQLKNNNSVFYFIYYEDALAGYLKLNEKEAQNEPFKAPSMELERIYILQQFQGNQIGKQSLFKVLELAKDKGMAFLWLGVWEHNNAAIRFYERHGFKKFGTHPYMLGSDKQTDWLMRYDFN